MKIIYLKPLSGYATPLRSDTLWGLLCWGIRHLWGEPELDDFIEKCKKGAPPFVVSSTFPFKQYGKEWIPFFPNPLGFPNGQDKDLKEAMINAELRKKYKKEFAFVNLDDFTNILKGELTATKLRKRLRDIYDEEERLKDEARRTRKPREERVISPVEVEQTAPKLENFYMTHNTIDRLSGGTLNLPLPGSHNETAGQLFHSPEHYWSDKYADIQQEPNTGIFFLADGTNEALDKYLIPILRLFRHIGFGADRTSGKGFFNFEIHDFQLSQPSDANALINLSLFRPTPEELESIDSAPVDSSLFHYQIELREGWASADSTFLPKQAHRYFKEGSVFPLVPALKKGHLGRLIQQFAKPHPVYDNGFGFILHLKWNDL